MGWPTRTRCDACGHRAVQASPGTGDRGHLGDGRLYASPINRRIIAVDRDANVCPLQLAQHNPPPPDPSSLAEQTLSHSLVDITSLGTLVTLDDGGALLVGVTSHWEEYMLGARGSVVRTLRMDPQMGAWTEIDRRSTLSGGEGVGGHVNEGALAARLANGRILVAGGSDWSARPATDEAWLYDPGSDTWTAVPPMPVRRAGGAAVTLDDGSVLLIGGQYEIEVSDCPDDGATGLATTVRFVPGS